MPRAVERGENVGARFAGAGQPLELVASAIPDPDPGQVLVRIAHVGVCGSELHYLDDPEESAGDENPGRLGFLGHEYSGVVEQVGEGVSGWEPGMPVVPRSRLACNSCERCRAADPECCVDQWRPQVRAYARFTAVRAPMLHAVPTGVSLKEAALATPLAECLQSIDSAGWRAGSRALVTGAGPMGLCTILLLRHSGASMIVATEPNEARRQFAASLGAIAVHPDDGIQAVNRLAGEGAIDVAFEASGSPDAFDMALSSLRVGGRLSLIGLAPLRSAHELDLRKLWHRRISIVPAGAPESTIERALRLVPMIDAKRLIAGEFSLSDINQAFVTARDGCAGKVLVSPGEPRNAFD